jgi:hypothetical protein
VPLLFLPLSIMAKLTPESLAKQMPSLLANIEGVEKIATLVHAEAALMDRMSVLVRRLDAMLKHPDELKSNIGQMAFRAMADKLVEIHVKAQSHVAFWPILGEMLQDSVNITFGGEIAPPK